VGGAASACAAGSVDEGPATGGIDAGTHLDAPADHSVRHDTGAPPADAPGLPETGSPPDAGDVDAFVADDGSMGNDAGDVDAGVDAGDDAGIDAGVDAGIDAGVDAGMDSGIVGSCAAHGFSGTLVTYAFAGELGSEGSVAAASSSPGVAGGALSRSSGITPQSGADSINSYGWAQTSSADGTKNYTLTLTPASGCTVTVSSLSIATSASMTGPAKADVATSADGFSPHQAAFTPGGTATPSLAGVSGSGPIELRIYGFAATSTTGTLRISGTFTVSGSIQ
jgi:hypothetical protein